MTMPATVRALRAVLVVQAAVAGTGALVAAVTFGVRRGDHLGLGFYAEFRSNTLTVVVIGVVTTAVLMWLAHLLPRRLTWVYRAVMALELIVLLDHLLGFVTGLFNLWLLAGILLAVTALWYLRAGHTRDHLLR